MGCREAKLCNKNRGAQSSAILLEIKAQTGTFIFQGVEKSPVMGEFATGIS